MSSKIPVTRLALVAALALLAPASARAQDDLAALVAVITDDRQSMEKREDALTRAAVQAGQQPAPRGGPLKAALGPLLDTLVGRRADAQWTRFTVLVLRALEPFRPYPDLAGRLRTLLAADSRSTLREAALRAVRVHGVAGLGAELEAYVRETSDAPEREGIERTMIEAAQEVPPEDGLRVLAAALEVSKHRGVRIAAARALGERRAEAGRRALVTACRPEEPDELVACEAALSLGRHGVLDGAGALVQRLQVRQGSLAVYRAACRAALREHEGFGGVKPGDYYDAGREGRARAVAAAATWWSAIRGRPATDALFDALKARGIAVPADRAGKEAVSALIEGLTVEPRSLRYAAHDRLVDLTGRADLAEGFRTIQRQMRGSVFLRETEPSDGFEDDARKEALAQHQAAKQAAWRQWWDGAKLRAELVGGKWVVRG